MNTKATRSIGRIPSWRIGSRRADSQLSQSLVFPFNIGDANSKTSSDDFSNEDCCRGRSSIDPLFMLSGRSCFFSSLFSSSHIKSMNRVSEVSSCSSAPCIRETGSRIQLIWIRPGKPLLCMRSNEVDGRTLTESNQSTLVHYKTSSCQGVND